jgi:hypothetical protein
MDAQVVAELRYRQAQLAVTAARLRSEWSAMASTSFSAAAKARALRATERQAADYERLVHYAEGS